MDEPLNTVKYWRLIFLFCVAYPKSLRSKNIFDKSNENFLLFFRNWNELWRATIVEIILHFLQPSLNVKLNLSTVQIHQYSLANVTEPKAFFVPFFKPKVDRRKECCWYQFMVSLYHLSLLSYSSKVWKSACFSS